MCLVWGMIMHILFVKMAEVADWDAVVSWPIASSRSWKVPGGGRQSYSRFLENLALQGPPETRGEICQRDSCAANQSSLLPGCQQSARGAVPPDRQTHCCTAEATSSKGNGLTLFITSESSWEYWVIHVTIMVRPTIDPGPWHEHRFWSPEHFLSVKNTIYSCAPDIATFGRFSSIFVQKLFSAKAWKSLFVKSLVVFTPDSGGISPQNHNFRALRSNLGNNSSFFPSLL